VTKFDPRLSGAAPVSRVEAVDEQTLFLVNALRKFGQSDEAAFWEGFAMLAGAHRGDAARSVFENLMFLITRHARRPLMTHDGACNCIGADEASFAQFVRMAAQGDPEDAMLIGMLILSADIVPIAVGLAQQLGLLVCGIVPCADMPQPGAVYH
jgi:hypothetical protein